MNIYLLILCLLSLATSTTHYCMEPSADALWRDVTSKQNEDRQLPEKHRDLEKVPERYQKLDWKADIRKVRKTTDPATKEYDTAINEILEYAADEYEEKKKRAFSEEKRKQLKIKLLRDAINSEKTKRDCVT